MPFEILTEEEQSHMAKYTVKERLYYTEDKTRVVPEGDPEARFLFAPAGRQILEETARDLGLLDEDTPTDTGQPAEEPDPAADEAAPPATSGDSSEFVESVTAGSATDETEPPAEAVQEEGHVCPDCGKVYKTDFGLSSHRRAKH